MSTVRVVAQWHVAGGPDGIAVNPHGEVFVNINQNHRVVRYSSEGDRLGEWSFEGTAGGIAAGSAGEVYLVLNDVQRAVRYGSGGEVMVNINQNHRVVRYSVEGERVAEWAAEGLASGIAVSPAGEVMVNINQNHRVVERGAGGEVMVNINQNHRVVRYSAWGEHLGEWPTEGGKSGIAVSPEGEVFSITSVLRVARATPSGDPLDAWSVVAGVIETNGIVVSPHGEVYVAIPSQHLVLKYGAGGDPLAVWGGEGDQPGEFRSPAGIALGPDGLVYVADRGNERVQVFHCP